MALAMTGAVGGSSGPGEPGDMGLLDAFFALVDESGERDALVLLEQCRRRCDAAEAQILAARVGAGDEGGAKRLLRSVGLSRRTTGRRLGRAKVVDANPDLGDRLASGGVSAEQVDVIAAADRASDGAASVDAGFVADVLGSGPDASSHLKKQWLARRRSKAEVAARFRHQRVGRDVWRHETDAGLAAITMAGDDATVDRLWARVGGAADRGYRNDGGRDIADHQHDRTYPQRLFDGLVDLIETETGSGSSARPSVVLTIDAAWLMGDRSDGNQGHGLEQIGTGPVADAVIIEALKNADLWTLVNEPTGQPLWLGRGARLASPAQLIAMICRDRGCVETGDHWMRTQAHHIVGWNAPARGETNVDEMALVSEAAHRDLHATGETFEYDPTIGKWRRRKATPREQSPRYQSTLRKPGGRNPVSQRSKGRKPGTRKPDL